MLSRISTMARTALLLALAVVVTAGCSGDDNQLADLIGEISDAQQELASMQTRVNELEEAVSFDPGSPKDQNEFFENQKEIGFLFQEQRAVQNGLARDYEEAIELAGGDNDLVEYLEKELAASKAGAESAAANLKIQNAYVEIWLSIVENQEILSASEYGALMAGLNEEIERRNEAVDDYRRLKQEAIDHFDKFYE